MPTDVRPVASTLFLLPVELRVPLKFGAETTTHVTCARVRLRVRDRKGREADGWGETPLSVHWVWPASVSYQQRYDALVAFCRALTEAWAQFECWGHPIEVGYAFQRDQLGQLSQSLNCNQPEGAQMPYLAALVCCSAFDLALHDAYGNLNGLPIYQTYNSRFMSGDLAGYLDAAEGSNVIFDGKYPDDFLVSDRPQSLPAWHLVGGLDPLASSDLGDQEPDDDYPLVLDDWIRSDGLRCLKIKLRGNDSDWDYQRIVRVGQIAIEHDVHWLSTDFNCTVTEPDYVNDLLDRICQEHPRIYGMVLYVEQPFPYELEQHRINVHSVAARKPLFMDESAHDWRMIRLGRSLGWTGVALKTCKTQTGAILSLCWAKAHGMTLMVQDLTNPMLAQIPHVLLAAHAETIMGVETNSMQFYPDASLAEAAVHPGLYRRRNGMVDLHSVQGPGFGYALEKISRKLGKPEAQSG